MHRFVLVAVALSVSSCLPEDYLLSGSFSGVSAFFSAASGAPISEGSLTAERGEDSQNHVALTLRNTSGSVDLTLYWDVDARGVTDVTGGGVFGADYATATGTVDVQAYTVDTGEPSGIRVTVDLGNVLFDGTPYLKAGAGTVGVGSLAVDTTGTGGGSGTTDACANRFTIARFDGAFPPALSNVQVSTATPTWSPVEGGAALRLASTELESGSPRFMVRLDVPSSGLSNAGVVEVVDNNLTPGLERGAVARVSVHVNGGSYDTLGTFTDASRDVVRGQVRVTAVSPKLRGTFSFTAYGDGYPDVSDDSAEVTDGVFCVDPP